MLCDGCKKQEANIVLHLISNGQQSMRSLCMDCARKAHGEMVQAFSTMGLRADGLQQMVEAQETEEKLRLPKMICSTCRTPYEDIDHNTVFGCTGCYSAFHQLVIDYLSGLRGTPEPESAPQANTQTVVRLSLDDLRQRLAAAVREEDYEQAASLRDQLRQLEAAAAGGEEANVN